MQTREHATRCVKEFRFDLKKVGDAGEIEGYGSVFNVEDSYGDIVAPGAFVQSIAEHRAAGTKPVMLWQHNSEDVIGTWDAIEEDSVGLKVKGQLILETQKARDAHALLKRGAIRGLSIGFMTKKWSVDDQSDIRTILECDLWEISLVTFPANRAANVMSVKSDIEQFKSPRDAERALHRKAGFTRSEATAFVSRVMRFAEDRRDADSAIKAVHQSATKLLETLHKGVRP